MYMCVCVCVFVRVCVYVGVKNLDFLNIWNSKS